MGGVQYSTFLLAEQIIKEKSADARIFLPGEGPFSTLCQKHAIPFSVYNSIPYISTSFSLLNDKFRIPNPLAWVYNICAILLNCKRIKKKLKQHVPDLAVTKGLLNHFSAGLACKNLNLPVIWHVQDLISQRYSGLLHSIFNYMAEKIPDHIICDGKVIRDSLKKVVRERATTVLNGIKIDDLSRENGVGLRVRHELDIPINAYVLGNMARITPWKGQELLLKVFIEYAELKPNAYLLLVGSPLFDNDKYYQHLMRLIIKHDLRNRVIMPGYRNDLIEIFSAIDLFLYPSLEKDTSPLSLLSAISFGLPVVVSNIKSLKEITDLCPVVDVFDPGDRDNLFSLMEKYEDKGIRDVNGRKNREVGKMYFDIAIHSEKMMDIFTCIVFDFN